MDLVRLFKDIFGITRLENENLSLRHQLVIAQNESVEEKIARLSIGMTDEQKAQYWYELDQQSFALLGKVDVPIYTIPFNQFAATIKAKYPEITGIEMADSDYQVTTRDGLLEILKRDWTNKIPYVLNVFDCDKYGALLYIHLVQYYGIDTVIPVWGWVAQKSAYHGFDLAVFVKELDASGNLVLDAQLIEPENDQMFDQWAGTWDYLPEKAVLYYARLGKEK